VDGHQRLLFARCRVFTCAVELALGDRAILKRLGREKRLRVFVLLDQALGNSPENLRPDFTDGVHTPVARLIERLVARGVDLGVLKTGRNMIISIQSGVVPPTVASALMIRLTREYG
jgi:hypothetical protein